MERKYPPAIEKDAFDRPVPRSRKAPPCCFRNITRAGAFPVLPLALWDVHRVERSPVDRTGAVSV